MAIYECTLQTTFAGVGSPAWNVFHVRQDGEPVTPGFDKPQAFIDAVATQLIPSLRGIMPTTATMRWPMTVRYLIPDTNPSQWMDVPVVPALFVGSSSTGELPERLALLVHLATSQPGRRGRGRKYHGPLATTVLETNGTVKEASRALCLSGYNLLLQWSEQWNGGGWGVWSRVDRVLRDVTRVEVNNEFAQLSSRRY